MSGAEGGSLPDVCVFDLDHTLVRSPLDLQAMRADVRALATTRRVALPESAVTWTVAQTIGAIAAQAPEIEPAAWAIILEHETRALDAVACEPGASEMLETLAASGLALAVWTNNARRATEAALARCGLASFFAILVTRDEAALKPDPDGLRLIMAAYAERPIWVIGDSWIDGAAAQAGGVAFIAYRTDPAELARRNVRARTVIHDLRALPAWLRAAGTAPSRV